MMARDLVAELLQQHHRRFHPAIVIDRRAGGTHPILVSGLQIASISLEPKAYRIATGFDLAVVPDDADGAMIEPGIAGTIVAVEMQIAKREAQHRRIAQLPREGCSNSRMIVLVQDLVGLQIERPVAGT